MNSLFSKLGGLLLCGVMLTAVGCHDYSADIKEATDKLDQDFTTDIAKLESDIQTLKGEAATATALQQAISDFNAGINGLKSNEIKTLQEQMAGKASSTDLDALEKTVEGINTKIGTLEGQFNDAIANLDKTYATDVQLDAAVATVNESIKKINGDITKINDALDGKADQTALETVEKAVNDLTTTVNGISSRLATAEENIKGNAAKILEVAGDLDQAKQNLTEAIAKAKDEAIAEAQAKVDAAKAELTDAIAKAKDEAIAEAQAKVDAANAELTKAIAKAKDEAIAAAAEAAQAKVEAAVGIINGEISKINDTISKLAERMAAVEVNVKNLIRSIQSIVYKPTHADGKARISYASVAGYTLEGNSTLTYKVYPKEYADSIATAFEDGVAFLSYDVINVTKSSTAKLEIKGISAKDGEIEVIVRANGLHALYTAGSEVSHSAALILDNEIDHYSTEYTNLTVDTDASNYKLVLYYGKEEYTGDVLANKVVFNDKTWKKNLFEGITAKFKPTVGEALDFEEFAKKYTLPEDAVIAIENTPDTSTDLFEIVSDEAALNVTLKEAYHASNAGKELIATSTYKFGTAAPVVAKAEVKLIEFPYTLKVRAKEESSTVGYNQIDKVFTPLTEYSIYFLDKDNKEVSVEEVEKTYFLKGENYVNVAESETGVKDLFDISKDIPVTVALKSENGVGKATAENVGDCIYLYYKHYDSVIEQSAATQEAKIAISKIQYGFDFAPISTQWTFKEDSMEDAANAPSCTREYTYAITSSDITSEDCPADQNISKVFADAGKLVKVTVNGTSYEGTTLADAPVKFVSVDAENVKIQYNELAWNAQTEDNKVYAVEAVYERESANVTVTATLTVKDRVRGVYDYGTIATIDPFVYVPNKTDWNNLATKQLDVVFAELVRLGYLGDGKNVTIEDVFVGTTVSKYEVNSLVAPDYGITTGIKLVAADPALVPEVVVGFNYKNLANSPFSLVGLDMPKKYDYVATIKTTYNQEIVLKSGVEFVDPVYDFVSTEFVKNSNKGYQYSVVTPLYYNAADALIKQDFNITPIARFGLDKVMMANAFEFSTPEGQIKASQLAGKNLKAKFTLEGTYEGINIDADNILTYGGKDDYVDVTGSLKLVNDNDTYYSIDKTIFTEDPTFANYRVYGYDPLNALTALKETQTWDLAGKTGEFELPVLRFFNITDKRGWNLISGDAFVVGDDNNGFAGGKDVKNIYGLDPKFDIKVVSPTDVTVTGITPDSDNGCIKAKVDANLGILHDIEIEVTLTISYPYAKDKVASFKVIIPKTHKEDK